MSGVKGRSGRHPRYVERGQGEFLKDNEMQLQRIINDPNAPAEWVRNARLAIFLKNMTNRQEHTVGALSDADQAVLDKYISRSSTSQALEHKQACIDVSPSNV